MRDIDIIHQVVCKYFNVIDLFEKTRKIEVREPRQWFFYILRTLRPRLSLSTIGNYGHRKFDHATVLHSINKIKSHIEYYPENREIEADLIYIIKREIAVFRFNHLTTCTNLRAGKITLT